MPELVPYTLGPTPALQTGAAAEMVAIIACLYGGDNAGFRQIVGPLVDGQTEELLWFVDATNTTVRAAVWTQPGHLYVAFGGTHAWHQWPRHFTGAIGAQYRDHGGNVVEGVGVQGFHQVVARGMWDIIRPTFPADWQSRQLRITGHSLGGSVAQLTGWRMAQQGLGAQVQTITYGGPRVILGWYRGPRPVAEYRVTNVDDAIPHMPFPYTSVVVRGLQALLAMRGGPRRPEGAVGQQDGGQGADIWRHYGAEYVVSNNGSIRSNPDFVEDRLQSPIHQVAFRSQVTHLVLEYMQRLEASCFLYGAPIQSRQAIDIGRAAVVNPELPYPPITIDPRTGADIQYSNAQLVPAPAAPLTPDNAASTQGVGVSSKGIGLADSVLKGNVLGTTMASLWDLTVFANNDRYGTSNTVALNGAEEAQARSICKQFGHFRACLLGNDVSEPEFSDFASNNGRGSPAIEYYRIRDAQNPRVGDVQPLEKEFGEPFLALDTVESRRQNSADPMFVAVNVSLTATLGLVKRRTILKITGVPDEVVRYARYNGTWIVGNNGVPFDTLLRNLIDFLTAPAGAALGISGVSPANEKAITAWAPDPVTGMAKATVPAHGWASGDQVRISGTKWWYLSRIWEIIVDDVNTFRLQRSQMTPLQVPPSTGKAVRVVTVAGQKLTTFYRFDRPTWMDGTPQQPIPVRVTKKRPGGPFEPASFRGTRKKIKR